MKNTALVNIRYFFKKQKNLSDPRLLHSSVFPHYLFIYIQPQIRKSWDSMENANKKRK